MKNEHPISIQSFGLTMPVDGQPYVEGGHGNVGLVSALLTEDGGQIGVSVDGRVELDSLVLFLESAKAQLAQYKGMNLDRMIDGQD